MSKANKLGMACHQALGFSRLFTAIPRAEAVFWPGCALMNLDPALLDKTLDILRREEPHIRLAAGCCGQPSQYLFPEKAPKRKSALAALLKKQGVKRVYTACPNCKLELSGLEDLTILSVWPLLARCLTAGDTTPPAGTFIWHDPCASRKDGEAQAACRRLLELSGRTVAQPEHTGPATLCCGSIRMLQTTHPEKSAIIRQKRLAELGDKTILSSCEGCLDAFRGEGRKTLHLLELLFGESQTRSWGNRFKTTQKAKR